MGASVRAWVRQHQLVVYFILAYLLTWVLVSPLALAGLRHTAPPVPEVWHALGALGPITAAFAVTAVALGRRGARQLVASMGRWRVGLRWLFVAVLSPFALFAISAVVARVAGQPGPDLGPLAARFGDAPWLLGAFLAAVVYGIGEEPGWRGFALPRLQKRWSALVAASLLTVLWAAWHIPFFAYRYHLDAISNVFFVLGLLAGSIFLTWLYNGAGGSVLMVMLWHMTWNMVNVMAAVVSDWIVALLTVEMIVAAAVIVLVWKPTTLAPAAKHTLDDELPAAVETPAAAPPIPGRQAAREPAGIR